MKFIKPILFLFCFGLLLSCNSKTKEPKPEEKSSQDIEESPFQKVDSVQLSSGNLYRISDFESKFVSPRNIEVLLPENYSKDTKYQVLLMHDGQMLYDSTTTWNKQEWGVDETISDLIQNNSIAPTIVVSTWNVNEDRHSDYFPQQPFDKLKEAEKTELLDYNKKNSDRLFQKSPNSDAYLKFLTVEVIPLVERHYAVSKEPQSYTVAGSSMGGLISFYALCEYPDIFGGAICMSTHWPGAMLYDDNPFPRAFFEYLDEKLPQLNNHKFYFDFGTETLDELYPPFQEDVENLFAKHNFDETNFKQLKFEGDAHDEKSWRDRLHIPFKFALE